MGGIMEHDLQTTMDIILPYVTDAVFLLNFTAHVHLGEAIAFVWLSLTISKDVYHTRQ